MPLENANYIPELDPLNPVKATDPVSGGAEQIQTVKRAIQGSFPSFEGNTTTPKSVSLTEDQINDTARQSEANTFTQTNVFRGTGGLYRTQFQHTDVSGRVDLAIAQNSGATLRGIFGIGDSDQLALDYRGGTFEIQNSGTRLVNFATNGQMTFENTVNVDSPGIGINILAAGKADGTQLLRFAMDRPWRFETGGIGAANNLILRAESPGKSFELQDANGLWFVRFTEDPSNVSMNNNVGLLGINAANTGSFNLIKPDTSDRVEVGDNNNGMLLRSSGSAIRAFHSNVEIFRGANRDNGSLLVFDIEGVSKKVGYRNPSLKAIAADYSVIQTDEGRILESPGGGTFTLTSLEANTTMRLINTGATPMTITGIAVAIECFLGGTSLTGTFTLAANSVIEIWWRTGTDIKIFGNGISS